MADLFLRGSVSWSSSTRCNRRLAVDVVGVGLGPPRPLPADEMDIDDDTEKLSNIGMGDKKKLRYYCAIPLTITNPALSERPFLING